MSVLRSLENKIAGLVEGTFSRAFRSEVRPVIARNGVTKDELNNPWWLAPSYMSAVTATGKIALRCGGRSTAASSWAIAK